MHASQLQLISKKVVYMVDYISLPAILAVLNPTSTPTPTVQAGKLQ